tara:strand:+ start:29570 stop:30721 length:1152 start_codon:yes stop_codon:yes gene_type:complete
MYNILTNYDKLCKCGYKKIDNKDYCCFMCSIGKGHGNKCSGRENNTIIIGSEGCGYTYSYFFINYLINLYNPNISIIFKNNSNVDIIICSHYYEHEKEWNVNNKKYIFTNWEAIKKFTLISHSEKFKKIQEKLLFTTLIENNSIHIPYGFVDYIKIKNLHLWNNNYLSIKNRKKFFGYCIKNTHWNVTTNRIKFIDLFTKYTKETYALGEYCNPKSIHTKLNFDYNGDKNHSNFLNKNSDKSTEELIKKYSEFKFILAAENTIEYGYMTEKIINALAAGCIPIYIGSSKYIKKVINPKRIIIANDYQHPNECINYILSLKEEDFDNYEKEPIFTNEKESEIFRELYNRDSPENKKLIDNMKYLVDNILSEKNNKISEISLNKI